MKNLDMKKTNILLLAAVMTGSIAAQDLNQRRHEIGIHAGGGLSTLQYGLNAGKRENGFGGQAGLAYTFFFSPRWGLGTGAEVALYQSKAILSGFTDSYDVQGATPNDDYTYTFRLNSYNETQQAFYVNIPLMLRYQTGGTNKFYAAMGGKVGLPVKAIAQTDDYSVSTQGYFPAEGRTYDDLPQYGFGTYNYAKAKTDLDFTLNLMASAELGVKWKTGSKNALYTGIYADYGVNNIQKINDRTFVQSALSAENPQMSPLVSSQYAGKAFTDKIGPLAMGVKLTFAFGSGRNFRTPEPEVVLIPPPVADTSAEEAAQRLAEEKAQQEAQRLAEAEAKRQAEEETKRRAVEHAIAEVGQPVQHYTLSQTELTASQMMELNKKIEFLQQYPDFRIFIYGHTCNIGNDAINERIGLQRAEKAKAYLISKGIAEERIIGTASKRDTEALVPNTGAENRSLNRRVEIVVQD